MMMRYRSVMIAIALSLAGTRALTGQVARSEDFDAHRPPLAFHAEWKRQQTPQHPMTQQDLIDQDLELKLYGDTVGILWTQHANEPTYAWTGFCKVNCALAVREKNHYVDMSGLSKIRWRSRQSGFHLLRPILKLADGSWLAANYADGETADWKISEINVAELRWRRLDMAKVVEAAGGSKWIDSPDLSRVDEVGFTDLTVGSGHGDGAPASRVAWVEVYGRLVPRAAK